MKTFENSRTLFRRTLIAAALVAGLGAAGASLADTGDSTAPPPPSDTMAAASTDTAITAQVKARYVADERLKASEISVTTTNGVVMLTGTVANSASKAVAVELAKGVEGVKNVDASGIAANGG